MLLVWAECGSTLLGRLQCLLAAMMLHKLTVQPQATNLIWYLFPSANGPARAPTITLHTTSYIICIVIVQSHLYQWGTNYYLSAITLYKWTRWMSHYDLTYHILHHMYRDSASSFVPFLQPPFVPVMSHRIRVVTGYPHTTSYIICIVIVQAHLYQWGTNYNCITWVPLPYTNGPAPTW